jgi:hypothetical protein
MPLYNPPASLGTTTDIDIDNIVATDVTLDGANGLIISADGGKDTIALSNTTSGVGITIGGDVEIWREAADTIRTSDTIQISTGAKLLTDRIDGYGGNNVNINGAWTFINNAAAYCQFIEQTDPAAPADVNVRLYAKDAGAGKTALVARFPTGAVQTIATEP